MFSMHLDQQATYMLMAMIPLVIQVGALAFAISVDAYFSKRQKQVFGLILILVLGLIAQNYTENLIATGSTPHDSLRTALSIAGYILRPVILLLLFYMVEPERRFRQGWVLVGLNTAIHLTAPFSHLVFSIENNCYQGGPLSYTCLFVSLILLASLAWISLRKSLKIRGKEIWIPIAIIPIILISTWLDYSVGTSEQPVTFLTIGIVGCCTLFFLWPHLQGAQEMIRKERERQRMQLMYSQIKPHFLYNTLETIEALCLTDPKAANEATARFSQYLRNNMAGIAEDKTVPFSKELSHAKLYLELEQTRFEDALQVEYHIGCTDFFLPPLTLEPLVENAVRHGVRMKPDGRGTVKIFVEQKPDCYEITVQDDGPGFDATVPPADGKPHIGIYNVRTRLEDHGGSLTIHSELGRGTAATIRVPIKKGE